MRYEWSFAFVFLLVAAALASTATGHPTNGRGLTSGAAIQYVSPEGNDSNDGLSWERSKLTGYAACEALHGGAAYPPTCGSGTIRISDSAAWGGPLPGGGPYFMGAGDPNYSSPPIGWQRYSGPLTIECGIPAATGYQGHIGECKLIAGGRTPGLPGFWLSSLTNFVMRDIAIQNYRSQGGRIGIASNGDRTGPGGVSSIFLDGISSNIAMCSLGFGPNLDIGSNSFWIYIHAPSLNACVHEMFTVPPSGLVRKSNIVTVTTGQTNDLRVGQTVNIQSPHDPSFTGSYVITSVSGIPQNTFTFAQAGPNATSGGTGTGVFNYKSFAIAIDPGSGTGSGLIFIKEPIFQQGGIWLAPGRNGGGVYVDDVSMEGNFVDPLVTVPVLVTKVVIPTYVEVNRLEESDFPSPLPGVEIDGPSSPDFAVINDAGMVRGVANVSAINPHTLFNNSVSPRRNGNIGTFGGRSNADTDAARRLFSPVSVRFPNLAATNPASWSYYAGSGTITPNVSDPAGGTQAGRVTSKSGLSFVNFYSSGSVSYGAGDYWIYGTWVHSATGNGYAGGAPMPPIEFSLNGLGYTQGGLCNGVGGPGTPSISTGNYVIAPAYQGDGQWEFISGICKMQVGPTGTYHVFFVGEADPSHTADFYGPVLLHIPSGTISDNEAWELAMTLQSYSHNCTTGTICGMDGQILHEDAFSVKLNTPASSSDKCIAGTIWADSKFVYVCTATNAIKRSALSSF